MIYDVFEVLIVFCSTTCIILRNEKEGRCDGCHPRTFLGSTRPRPNKAQQQPSPFSSSTSTFTFHLPPLHLLVRAVCIGLFYWVYSQPSRSTATLVCPRIFPCCLQTYVGCVRVPVSPPTLSPPPIADQTTQLLVRVSLATPLAGSRNYLISLQGVRRLTRQIAGLPIVNTTWIRFPRPGVDLP